MGRTSKSKWRLAENFEPNMPFVDPRLAIVKQTGWVVHMKYGKTMHSLPEPDNYNFAIFTLNPHDIKEVKYQCWYRDRIRGGWFNLYVIQCVEEANAIHKWLQNNSWLAYWEWDQSPKLRTKMPKIENDNKRMYRAVKNEFTFDELLYNQGYYDKLLEKGVDEIFLQKYTGTCQPLQIEQQIEQEINE